MSGSSDRGNPRRLGASLGRVISASAPRTLLGEVQTAWPEVCGETIGANAEPVAERNGVVTVACGSGAWAQELELMGELLQARLEEIIGSDRVVRLRFTADLSRHR